MDLGQMSGLGGLAGRIGQTKSSGLYRGGGVDAGQEARARCHYYCIITQRSAENIFNFTFARSADKKFECYF